MVNANSIAMRPKILTLHPFFGIACAWTRNGVGFSCGRVRLTCCRGQLIIEEVDFIAEYAIYFCIFATVLVRVVLLATMPFMLLERRK